MDGFGYHEVIVETPEHDRTLASMQEDELVDVLLTYRERYLALKTDPRVKLVLIFKNYGERAGSSIAHPHSQVVATPIIPGHIRRKYEVAVQHYDDTGRCYTAKLSRPKIDTVSELFIDPTNFSYLSLMPHGSHSKLG